MRSAIVHTSDGCHEKRNGVHTRGLRFGTHIPMYVYLQYIMLGIRVQAPSLRGAQHWSFNVRLNIFYADPVTCLPVEFKVV